MEVGAEDEPVLVGTVEEEEPTVEVGTVEEEAVPGLWVQIHSVSKMRIKKVNEERTGIENSKG